VRQLAHEGRCASDAFAASVGSIRKLDAGNTEEIFSGVGGVHIGLEFLRDKLSSVSETLDVEIARYVVAMLHLASRLTRRRDAQETIRNGIATIERQMAFFEGSDEAVHPSLVEKLAELYIQTLSTLAPRIIVTGEHGYLVNPLVAARVRAALFAGIRAAFLWRQLGGRRWQLVLSRRKIMLAARELLDETRGA
jgi:high frequency lysogenization protein